MSDEDNKKPSTLEDAPIGVLDDGKINLVDKDAPPWKPKVIDADGNEVDLDELDKGKS